MAAARIDTKFLILSDTHLERPAPADKTNMGLREPIPIADVVLHCGDLTDNGTLEGHTSAIEMLAALPAPLKLVIAGNHEIDLDGEYYKAQGGDIRIHDAVKAAWADAEAKGIHLLQEGTHTFTLANGAVLKIHASPYTPKPFNGESAFQYASNEDRWNPEDFPRPPEAKSTADENTVIPEGLDVLLTHGPPQYILDNGAWNLSLGCPHLRRAVSRARPRMHCFGHIHGEWGYVTAVYDEEASFDADCERCPLMIEPMSQFVGKNTSRKRGRAELDMRGRVTAGQETVFINAAIAFKADPGDGGEWQEFTYAPWLVTLDLPAAGPDQSDLKILKHLEDQLDLGSRKCRLD